MVARVAAGSQPPCVAVGPPLRAPHFCAALSEAWLVTRRCWKRMFSFKACSKRQQGVLSRASCLYMLPHLEVTR